MPSKTLTWRATPDGYHERIDADGRIHAAYGPNPYGLMGQGWTRAWKFDPEDGGVMTDTLVTLHPDKAREWCEGVADAVK